jgi:hypothetical protein
MSNCFIGLDSPGRESISLKCNSAFRLQVLENVTRELVGRLFIMSLINNAAEYFGTKNTTKIVKDPALNSGKTNLDIYCLEESLERPQGYCAF